MKILLAASCSPLSDFGWLFTGYCELFTPELVARGRVLQQCKTFLSDTIADLQVRNMRYAKMHIMIPE